MSSSWQDRKPNPLGTARRYWDAYNLGLFLAVAVIVAGSGLGLLSTLRERAEARAG